MRSRRTVRLWPAACGAVLALLYAQPARAGSEVGSVGIGVRIGYANPSLRAGDVPFAGETLEQAVATANHAIDAYNLAVGAHEPRYDARDLNLDPRMLQVTPSLHLGGSGYFFKAELPMGFSSELRMIGIGLYPLNLGIEIASLRVFPYGSAGVVVSYATSSEFTPTGGKTIDVDASGLILELRLALGVKYSLWSSLAVSLEVGYSPYAFGFVHDGNRPHTATGQLPEHPAANTRGGSGSITTVLVGVDWL